MIRRGTRIAAVALALGLLGALSACAASPTTSYTDESGETVTVNWRDYPATAWYGAEEALGMPMTGEVGSRSRELLQEARVALEQEFGPEFGLSAWEALGDPADYEDWYPMGGNGYGGDSMLVTFNSQSWEAEATIPREQWSRMIDVVAEVAERYGIEERVLDEIDPEYEVWMRSETLFHEGEWLSVSVQDARLDPTGAAAEDARQGGWAASGVSISYGITTIRDEDRAEFERRAAPFAGLDRPAETHPD